MYNYNYLKNKLWSLNINFKDYNKGLNPYLLLKIIKEENNQNNNNKYFYLLDNNSIFIIHKLNNIILIKLKYLKIVKKLEYSHFLILYLLKYISFNNEIKYQVIENILKKIFYFLKPLKFKMNNKKQSYNFCKYNFQCKLYYEKKNCCFDHYPYGKLCIDIKNIITNIEHYNNENLKKYIVTVHYVIEHIYNEFFMYRYINE